MTRAQAILVLGQESPQMCQPHQDSNKASTKCVLKLSMLMKADALNCGPVTASPRWLLTSLSITIELQDVLREGDIRVGWLLKQAPGSPSTSQG